VPITPQAIADDPALGTMQCWDLMASTTGDWSSAGLRATLPSGSFYNHPFGTNVQPSTTLSELIPALRFDTYVTAPTFTGPPAPAPSILGGFPMGQPLSMSGQLISISWEDSPANPGGVYPIARLTFPLGVIPDVLTADQNAEFSYTAQRMPNATTPVPEIPEPGALGVAMLTALACVRSRGAGMSLARKTGGHGKRDSSGARKTGQLWARKTGQL
jgi:hypothetical protein